MVSPLMARLTNSDRHLLRHPPTEGTWYCGGKFYSANDQAMIPCKVVNPGDRDRCWLCGSRKPKKPKLLWPLYLKVCQRAGHVPGEKWPSATVSPETPTAPRRRKRG